MRRTVGTLAVVTLLVATTGCLGLLDDPEPEPSGPEMDEPNTEYAIQQVDFREDGPDDPTVTFKPTLEKDEDDPVTVEYTLVADAGNSTETFHRIEDPQPEHVVDLPDGTEAGERVTVAIELQDGNETVDTFLGEFRATYGN
jgi:hypothetical protein